MKINIQKVEADLAGIRQERTRIEERLVAVKEREFELTSFITTARLYADGVIPVVAPVDVTRRRATLSRPGTLRPVAKTTLGGRARARRIELGLSQKAVAAKAGCSNETVSSVELNRSVGNRMKTMVLKALGLTSTGRVSNGKTVVRPVTAARVVSAAPRQQTIVAQAVVAAFQAGDIINGRDVFTKTAGSLIEKLKMPESVVLGNSRFTPTHLIANLLMLEARQGGILERVSTGHYRVRENANDIIANRLGSQE